jgi:glutamyl-tRNA reductase
MPLSVFALGLNHTTAPLDLRSRFAFAPEQLAAHLLTFRQQLKRVSEATMVSTCNRTELYVGAGADLVNPALLWLAQLGGVSENTLREHAYVLQGQEAARHAFRVASGLDSMVLGEPQILGQLKQAVREAQAAGSLGGTLHQMFQRSFSVAKDVRTSTEIGAHSISMAAAAVRLAAQLFEDLRETKVLLVGAGDMIELVATHFAARQPRAMVVANRTLARGEALAHRFGAQSMHLTNLPERLAEFDIVVACTASALPVIGLSAMERALKLRRHRPVLMVDLGVPRDIAAEVARLSDIYLYTVDDLSSLVQSAGEKRQAAVAQAESIIDAGVQSFVQWLDQRSSVPLIQALQSRAELWRSLELSRAQKMLAKGLAPEVVLEALARGLTQKMLHGTLAELNATDGEQRAELELTVARLFLRQNAQQLDGDPMPFADPP